jgi:hypothetical protein
MPVEPINLTAVIAVIMGISVVLVPIIGLTARFALKPAVEALSQVFESKQSNEALHIVERRLALLETQMESLESSVGRLADAVDFDAQLKAGAEGTPDQLPPP